MSWRQETTTLNGIFSKCTRPETVITNFKMSEIAIPIITEVGKIWGRDAIFLDKVNVVNESTFQLIGEFNGALCSNLKDNEDRKYKITFFHVHLFKMIELDYDDTEYESAFDLLENSKELLKMKNIDKTEHLGKIDDSYKHYIFRTYDTVFEIIGKQYELTLE